MNIYEQTTPQPSSFLYYIHVVM